MGKCRLRACNYDKLGNEVPSKLFDELEKYFGNVKDAWKYYALSKKLEFRDINPELVELDEFGDMTIKSFLKLSKITPEEALLQRAFEKELGSQEYDFIEGINKLTEFNLSNPFNEKYLASFNVVGDKIKLKIVANNIGNQRELYKNIEKRNFADRLIFTLALQGIGIKIFDPDNRTRGIYNTMDIDKMQSALKYIIGVAKGELIQMDPTLAKEVGHLIASSMEGNPLLERLNNLLTDEVIESIYEKDFLENPDYQREALGHLIGDALYDNYMKPKSIKNLVLRLFNAIKRVFSKLSFDDILKARAGAQEYASKIAKQFVLNDFTIDTDKVFEIREKLYDRDSLTRCEEMLRDSLSSILRIANKIRPLNKKMSNSLLQAEARAEGDKLTADYEGVSEGFIDSIAMDGIRVALESLTSYIPSLTIDLEVVNDNLASPNRLEAINPDNSKKILTVKIFVKESIHLLEDLLASSGFLNKTNPGLYESLVKTIADFNNQLLSSEGILPKLIKLEFEYGARVLEGFYGKEYIDAAKRKIWKEGKLVSEGMHLSMEDILRVLDLDISPMALIIFSAANSGDIALSILDKGVKSYSSLADESLLKCWDLLNAFRRLLIEINKSPSTEMFYSRNKNGALNGYLISPSGYNWGEYYYDKHEFIKNARKEFLKGIKESGEKLSKSQIEDRWCKELKLVYREWDATHRKTIDKKLVPIDTYKDNSFEKIRLLNPKLADWYLDFLEFYKELVNLTDGNFDAKKAPQCRGSVQNIIRNNKIDVDGTKLKKYKAIYKGIRSKILSIIGKSSEDWEFGGDNTYNSPEEDVAFNRLEYALEALERIPLHNINTLKNMNDLKTDLLSSTLLFAASAITYSALNLVVDSFNIVKDALEERSVGGIKEKHLSTGNYTINKKYFFKYGNKTLNFNYSHSRAFKRMVKFYDMELYGKQIDVNPSNKIKILLTKLILNMSKLGSFIYLAGNSYGAIANNNTGFIEILKEAGSGEFYNLETWGKANSIYVKSIPSCAWNYGNEKKNDKFDLFMLLMNALHSMISDTKDWHSGTTFWNDIFNHKNIITKIPRFLTDYFILYKAGDHYMQSISYLSLALNTKFYDLNDKEINLWDALEKVPINDDEKNGYTLRFKRGLRKKNANIEEYNTALEIIDIFSEKGVNVNKINNDPRLMQFLIDHKILREGEVISNDNLALIRGKSLSLLEDLTFSALDLADIKNKAREINTRMHGIYNNFDKTFIHGSLAGMLFTTMKGYAFGLIVRRFSGNVFNASLDLNIEGTFDTMFKVLWEFGGDFKKSSYALFKVNMLKKFKKDIEISDMDKELAKLWAESLGNLAYLSIAPFTKKSKEIMLDRGYDINLVSNVMRNQGDLISIGLGYLFKYALSKLNPDRDDDEILIGNLYYFVSRALAEQEAYNNPYAFIYRESSSILSPERTVGWSFIKQVVKATDDLITGEEYKRDDPKGRYKKGDNKGLTFFKRYAPSVDNAFDYIIPFRPNLRFLWTFEHPYEAAESYEYSKAHGNK